MAYIGKKSWARVIKGALIAMMIITVVLLIALPKVITWYLNIEYGGTGLYEGLVLLIMLYPCALLALLIENELRRMFKTLENNDPFVMQNITSLKRMGYCMLGIIAMFVFKIIMLNTIMTMICAFGSIVVSLFCFVLAEVFHQAVQHKLDNDLTI